MERITPDDAALLHLENEVSAVHGITVGVFEGPEPTFDDLFDHVGARVPLVPRYRQRLVDVPFGLERPVWVDDPHFRLEYHVRHTALPYRRDDNALASLVSRLLSQRLDRTKPLWELWMVSGLKDGHWAIISKVHYALIDGVSGTDLFGLLLDDAATGSLPDDDFQPPPLPGARELLPQAAMDLMFNPIERYRATRRAALTPFRLGRQAVDSVRPQQRTPFRTDIGPNRRWERLQLPLGDLRAIRDQQSCTTSDVILAAICGGIRHYLFELGEAIPSKLSALIPLAVASEETSFKHEVTALRTDLPIGTDDPIARLDSIGAQTRITASSEGALAGEALRRQDQFSAPTLMATGVRAAMREGRRAKGVDTVIVNVPGPAERQSVLGHELLKAYPVVPLTAQVRVAFAAMSYRDVLSIGITGDWDTAPDLHLLADGIRAAVTDLRG